MQNRQAVLYGVLISALVLVSLVAAAVYSGTMDPLFDRPFTSPDPSEIDGGTAVACPPPDTLPLAYNSMEVRVLNSTTRAGLASVVAGQLAERGFAVHAVGNYPGTTYSGTVMIAFGTDGLAAAHTISAQFSEPSLVLDTRTGMVIDVVVGAQYQSLIDPTAVLLDPNVPLQGPEGCLPVEEVTPEPYQAPTTTPFGGTEDEEPPGEGEPIEGEPDEATAEG